MSSPTPADQLRELTFEQQQKIDELSLLANTPSSNQNKHRFNLYAYINEIIDQYTANAVRAARLDDAHISLLSLRDNPKCLDCLYNKQVATERLDALNREAEK